jgi:hypothetical protein
LEEDMAVKGLGYTKTAWAFQERPVASAKLNLWDDRIEAALELTYRLLNLAWGGGSGVIRGATADDLKVVASSPATLHVHVKAGYGFISELPYNLGSATNTADVSPPVSHPRIDLVQARLDTWGVTMKTGTESASPVPPSADPDSIVLARLYLRPGMTSIRDTDDSVNGYIIDARTFL